jgi:voltage-gated potassium channel
MKSVRRRLRANLIFLRKPFREVLPLVLALVALLAIGAFCFHRFSSPPLGWGMSVFVTYCLLFMEHVDPIQEHWLLHMFYYILPPLSMIVILDGVVRFSYRILRRDENSEEWVSAMAHTMENHVILVGLGKVGFRVLEELLKLGEQVVILEKNPLCDNLAYARNHGVPALIGTGRQEGVFESLNAAKAKSIILATSDDLANLEMALDARKTNPNIRVVMRMYDNELAAKVSEGFDISLAFSTSALSAPTFATSSSDRSIVSSFYVNDALLVVAKLTINGDSEMAGKTIADYGKAHDVFFLSHARGPDATFYPQSTTKLLPGDRVTVQTRPVMLKQLHAWNRDKEPY